MGSQYAGGRLVQPEGGPARRLYRSRKNRMLAGVVGGIAEYIGVDPTIARVVWVIVSIFLPPMLALDVLLYVALALIIPPSPEDPCPSEPRRAVQVHSVSAPRSNRQGQERRRRCRTRASAIGALSRSSGPTEESSAASKRGGRCCFSPRLARRATSPTRRRSCTCATATGSRYSQPTAVRRLTPTGTTTWWPTRW